MALAFAEAVADVALTGRDSESLEKTAQALPFTWPVGLAIAS
jgi:hypothetical protein